MASLSVRRAVSWLTRRKLTPFPGVTSLRWLRYDGTGPDVPAFPTVAPWGPNAGQAKPAGTEVWHERLATSGSMGRKYKWPTYNMRVHLPLDEEPADSEEARLLRKGVEPRLIRPAYVCHMRAFVKYSPVKMLHVATLVRGLSVDEALKQLQFLPRKGAVAVAEVIEECREMAVRDHGVEFGTDLWVAESWATQSMIVKGQRRHGRGKIGQVRSKDSIETFVHMSKHRSIIATATTM